MSRENLKDALTIINGAAPAKESKTISYKADGKTDELLTEKFNDDVSVARFIDLASGPVYRVKSERNGKLFNPLFDKTKSYNLNAIDKVTKSQRFQFKTVSKKAFIHYIKFLSSKYDSLLIEAERSI